MIDNHTSNPQHGTRGAIDSAPPSNSGVILSALEALVNNSFTELPPLSCCHSPTLAFPL
jgi:hypothetical protein